MQITNVVRELQTERAKVAAELNKLDAAISALRGVSSNGVSRVGQARRGVMSASARRKIAAAQKARWAKWRRMQKAA